MYACHCFKFDTIAKYRHTMGFPTGNYHMSTCNKSSLFYYSQTADENTVSCLQIQHFLQIPLFLFLALHELRSTVILKFTSSISPLSFFGFFSGFFLPPEMKYKFVVRNELFL